MPFFCPKLALEVAQQAMDTASNALNFYNSLDKEVPWSKIVDIVDDLDEQRLDQTKVSADLIGKVHTNLLNGLDAYHRLSERVYEWTGLVTPLLMTYLKLFNGFSASKCKAQTSILVKILNEESNKMNMTLEELEIISSNFTQAAKDLATLVERLEKHFEPSSEFFQRKLIPMRGKTIELTHEQHVVAEEQYKAGEKMSRKWKLPEALPNSPKVFYVVQEEELIDELKESLKFITQFYSTLKETADKTTEFIEYVKSKLQNEAPVIAGLKERVGAIEPLDTVEDNVRESVLKSANNLMDNAKEYQHRHKTDA